MNINKILTTCLITSTFIFSFLPGNHLMAESVKPCSATENRQFDFWIGDWEVKNAKGDVAGYNKIFPILDGCALSENWESARGNPGVSYNFYDKAEKKWHQTWIDSNGGVLYLDGGMIGDSMVLTGSRPTKDGSNSLQKITWTPLDDGRVKQHWQSSKDGGKSWSNVFVGFYSKKK